VVNIRGIEAAAHGRILPGADWQIAPDGAPIPRRATIETDRGTRVLVTSDGLRHGRLEVIAALARGEAVEPARYYFPPDGPRRRPDAHPAQPHPGARHRGAISRAARRLRSGVSA
jgi:hypothetical protein